MAMLWASAFAQRAMTVEDLARWEQIAERSLSDDGTLLACKWSPWLGDSHVMLYTTTGQLKNDFKRADQFKFSSSGKWLILREAVAKDTLDAAKLKKVKRDKMPMPRLILHNIALNKSEFIDSLKNYEVSESTDWVAYRRTQKDSTLVIRGLVSGSERRVADVSTFGFSKKNGMLWYVVGKNKKSDAIPGLYMMKPEDGKGMLVKEGEGVFSQMAFNELGTKLAFMYSPNKKQDYKNTEVWLSEAGGAAKQVCAKGNASLATDWVVSKYGRVNFSDDGSRLFFGTSPEPLQKDSTVLEANRPKVQVWSYNEPVQYTEQVYDLKADLRKNYTAVLHIVDGKIVQLSDEALPNMGRQRHFVGDYALVSTSKPYSTASMWEGRSKSDCYAVNMLSGEKTLISKAEYTHFSLSPAGKYAFGYNEADSCWWAVSVADGVRHKLTSPATFIAWDEEEDRPDYPSPYGVAGWTANDESVLVYDRYDIWQIDPTGKKSPVNLTVNGRATQVQYRYVSLDPEEKNIDLAKPVLLRGFNVVTRDAGYYSLSLKKGKPALKALYSGGYILRDIVKAKNSNVIAYTEENYVTFPDLIVTDLTFKKRQRITEGYKQQEGFKWGTVELVHWTTPKGVKLDGMLFRPDGFDPNKKYPMIVNFYERYSETLHNYRMPQPNRSTVDYHLYNSDDYVMFCPDIRYSLKGTPGEDCYDCVMSGIQMVVDMGFVDEKAIGAQGHSWGGYQTAYLATKTSKFAAIESGAPVVNMFSAYGGIRWGSGKARAFQYEHTQSRVGGSIWEVPELYKANSPLFEINKVTTPILIMANDNDGHVPWYQGIEFFVAMKRNQKPCWLLNYTGEPHWPLGMPNKMDFQKRMKQFFDHYLKGTPMPKWMSEGVPAVKQPYELGY